jgi:hypothetical protein
MRRSPGYSVLFCVIGIFGVMQATSACNAGNQPNAIVTQLSQQQQTALAAAQTAVVQELVTRSAQAQTAVAAELATKASEIQTAVARELITRLPPGLVGDNKCPEIAQGVRHCVGSDYHLIVADLSNPAVSVHVVAADNWTDPEAFNDQTVLEMAHTPRVRPDCEIVAGINGGYFGNGQHNSLGWTVVNGDARRDMQQKVASDPTYTPQHWPSFVIPQQDGIALIGAYLWRNTPARAAVTAGPIFIVDGQDQTPRGDAVCAEQHFVGTRYCAGDNSAYAQSDIAISRDGHTVYLYSAQKQTLAQAARVLGPNGLAVWRALKLDASTSAQMIYRSGSTLHEFIPAGGGGSVTDAILICSR